MSHWWITPKLQGYQLSHMTGLNPHQARSQGIVTESKNSIQGKEVAQNPSSKQIIDNGKSSVCLSENTSTSWD